MLTSPTRNLIAVLALTFMILGTLVYLPAEKNESGIYYGNNRYGLAIFLSFIGIVLAGLWFLKIETNVRKKVAMGFLIFGLFLIWSRYHWYLRGHHIDEYDIVWIISILIFLSIGIGLAKIRRVSKYKGVERRNFSTQTRKDILKNQNNKCARCKDKLTPATIQYDHIDGDRSNNDPSNCQALCSNCHSSKTRSV